MGCGVSAVAREKAKKQAEDKRKQEKKKQKEEKKAKAKKEKPQWVIELEEQNKKLSQMGKSKDKYRTIGAKYRDQGKKGDTMTRIRLAEERQEHESMMKKQQQEAAQALVLSSYVPWAVLRRFELDVTPVTGPEYCEFEAALVIIDISGFTSLGEKLAALPDNQGVELLATHINKYFEPLIRQVHKYGGSIEKFAGDALIALWGSEFHKDQTPADMCEAAIACAIKIQEDHGEYAISLSGQVPGWQNQSIGVHIGLGFGEVKTLTLGGLGDSWRRLVLGAALSQLEVALGNARRGEVVVSDELRKQIDGDGEWFAFKEVPEGAGFLTTPGKSVAGTRGWYVHRDGAAQGIPDGKPVPVPTLTSAMERGVRGFIDFFLQSRLDAGQQSIRESRQLSALFITINNFASMTAEMGGTEDRGYSALHQLVRFVQATVYRFEGCIANCLVDEKGCSIIITYGMPQHDDDPVRAVRSALEIRDKAMTLEIGLSMGVTSGDIFVGSIGSEERRDYTIMGPVVNLAARLMSLCDKVRQDSEDNLSDGANEGEATTPADANIGDRAEMRLWSLILVDRQTEELTRPVTLYEQQDSQRVKGCEGEVQIWVPLRLFRSAREKHKYQKHTEGADGANYDEVDTARACVEVAREEELKALNTLLATVTSRQQMLQKGEARTRLAIVYGAEGMGKTHLVRHAIDPFEAGEIAGHLLETAAEEEHQPYGLWEPIFMQLLLPVNIANIAARRQALLAILTEFIAEQEWFELSYLQLDENCWLSLLNPVLKTNFTEPTQIEELGTNLKKRTMHSMLHIILKILAKAQPIVIMMEDMQRCKDVASLELLRDIIASNDRESRICIICSARPRVNPADDPAGPRSSPIDKQWDKLEKLKSASIYTLEPFDQAKCCRIVVTILHLHAATGTVDIPNVDEIHSHLAGYIYEQSRQGQMFLLVAISESIRDELVAREERKGGEEPNLEVVEGRLQFAGGGSVPPHFQLNLPKSVTHFVRSTIDKLPATQQMFVKCAAVVGKKFSLDLLHAIFPVQSKSKADLLSAGLSLIEEKILVECGEGARYLGGETSYRFKDGVLQEEAYSMVLHDQRRDLHHQIAQWIETEIYYSAAAAASTEEEQVNQLSRHWHQYLLYNQSEASAEEIDKAIRFLRRNAENHEKFNDPSLAVTDLQTAISLLALRQKKTGTVTSSVTVMGGTASSEHSCSLLELSLLNTIKAPANRIRRRLARDYLAKIHQRAVRVGDSLPAEELAHGKPPWIAYFGAAHGAVAEMAELGRAHDTPELVARVQELARRSRDPIEGVAAAHAEVLAATRRGDDYAAATKTAAAALDDIRGAQTPDMPDPFADTRAVSFCAGPSLGSMRADLLCCVAQMESIAGRFPAAAAAEEELLTVLSIRTGRVELEARVLCAVLALRLLRGCEEDLMAKSKVAAELANDSGDQEAAADAAFLRAYAQRELMEARRGLHGQRTPGGLGPLLRCILAREMLLKESDPDRLADALYLIEEALMLQDGVEVKKMHLPRNDTRGTGGPDAEGVEALAIDKAGSAMNSPTASPRNGGLPNSNSRGGDMEVGAWQVCVASKPGDGTDAQRGNMQSPPTGEVGKTGARLDSALMQQFTAELKRLMGALLWKLHHADAARASSFVCRWRGEKQRAGGVQAAVEKLLCESYSASDQRKHAHFRALALVSLSDFWRDTDTEPGNSRAALRELAAAREAAPALELLLPSHAVERVEAERKEEPSEHVLKVVARDADDWASMMQKNHKLAVAENDGSA